MINLQFTTPEVLQRQFPALFPDANAAANWLCEHAPELATQIAEVLQVSAVTWNDDDLKPASPKMSDKLLSPLWIDEHWQ